MSPVVNIDVLVRLKQAAEVKAAANPADGPWFFFVAVNPITGETKYGVTLDDHNKNVRELTAYCKEKPKDCGL